MFALGGPASKASAFLAGRFATQSFMPYKLLRIKIPAPSPAKKASLWKFRFDTAEERRDPSLRLGTGVAP